MVGLGRTGSTQGPPSLFKLMQGFVNPKMKTMRQRLLSLSLNKTTMQHSQNSMGFNLFSQISVPK